MTDPTDFDRDPLDPEYELQGIDADIKELSRECKKCSAPGILMTAGVLGEFSAEDHRSWGEEYKTWYCEAHLDEFIADAAFCAAVELTDGPPATEQMARQSLRRLGFTAERIAAVGLGADAG